MAQGQTTDRGFSGSDIQVTFATNPRRNEPIAMLCCRCSEFRCSPNLVSYGTNGGSPVLLVLEGPLDVICWNTDRNVSKEETHTCRPAWSSPER